MMKQQKIFVLAGSFTEFKAWLRRTNTQPDRAVYIGCPATLSGQVPTTVVRFGTWWKRDDLEEIEDIIRIRTSNR
jgi:hypothetical protein